MNTAFQKVYTKITQITKATCSLKAQGVGNDELAIVNGRLAQVVKGVFCNVRCNGPAVFSESKTPMGTFPGNRRNFPRGEANDRFILDAQQRLPCGYDEASSGSDFIPS